MNKFLTGILLLLAVSANSWAQSLDDQITLARQAHNTDREALITLNVHFTVAEGEAFWPLYHEYRKLMQANGDLRLALIKEFAAAYETLTDEQAERMLLKSYDIEEDRTTTRRQYALRFQEVLPGKKVARIMQMESKMDTAIDMQLAAEIPLVR